MSRRFALLLALIASMAIAACSSTPVAPALTDPKEILTKGAEATLNTKSFHFQATVTGTFNADLMGAGQASEFKLDGTTLEGDVDVANKKVKASFSVPALLGLNGELIQIGNTSYVKTSLTGTGYQKQVTDEVPVDEVTDPAKAIEELRKALEQPGVAPTKAADAKCGDKDCYQIEWDFDAEELAALASAAPVAGEDLGDATFKLTIGVEKDTLRYSTFTMSATEAEMGTVSLSLNLSGWDEAVSIEEPPADQVTGG